MENRASGIIPVAKLLENAFSYANQLGTRKGSGVIYLNIFHGDVEQFLSAKKPNADEKIQLATLSTGLIIPDIFFQKMENDEDIYLFSPYDIKKEYDITMSDFNFTERYQELVDNPNIRKLKRLNARKLYSDVKKTQIESGYPFEMYIDTVNEDHQLGNVGNVRMSNLCTEILQAQTTTVVGDFDEPDETGIDVSCNLGSIDIYNAVKQEDFGAMIKNSMLMLTYVSETSNIKVESIQKGNNAMHAVGLGVMNLHGHLANSGILYGSDDSLVFADLFFESMNFFSIKASMEIAKEKGETFLGFAESGYGTGEYFDKYVDSIADLFIDSNVVDALGNVPIISSDMWKELKEDVMKYGMYHAYRLAIAP